MPFRESQMSSRGSGANERWLRRIFVRDWSLKLLALAITLVLWFVVSGRDVERELLVEPQLKGSPAPSFEVKEVVVTPSRIRVRGAASHVNALEKAQTEAISIDGRRESFDLAHTSISLSDPKVGVLDKVNVHVVIVADETSKPQSRGKN